MKKSISILTAFVMQLIFMTLPLPAASAKSADYSLFDKFLKYDLCITDYNALTKEEKELCHFIFDTEQSADGTVICERARRTLAHDPNIGDRLKLEDIVDCYGIWDNYSPSKIGYPYYIHCVPDIKFLDDWYDYNEYWLDDTGNIRVRSIGENTGDSGKAYPDMFEFFAKEVSDISEYENFCRSHEVKHEHSQKEYDGTYSYSFCIGRKKYIPLGPNKNDSYIENGNAYYNLSEYDGVNDFFLYDGDLYEKINGHEALFALSKHAVSELHNFDAPPITEKIVIPSEVNGYTVKMIGSCAFLNSFITSVSLPETIERIENDAFRGCFNLTDINFPDSLKYIGTRAFNSNGFSSLDIDLPELVIAKDAFLSCNKLTEISINADTIGESAFMFCQSLTDVTLGDSIRTICSDAFMGCASLENVSLGSSVKSVGTGAFGNFKIGDLSNYPCGLREITIQPTVEIIGSLPRAQGIGATTGAEIKATHPLTDEQECVFDSDCVIKGYKGTEAERYANEWGLEFEALEAETGDVNLDGEITVADAVALQRFLLGKYVSTGAYYGDMNSDGTVDAFDMVFMRKKLIKKD